MMWPKLILFSSSWDHRNMYFLASFVIKSGPYDWVLDNSLKIPCVFFHLLRIFSPPSRATFCDSYLLLLRWQHHEMEGAWNAWVLARRRDSQQSCLACTGLRCMRGINLCHIQPHRFGNCLLHLLALITLTTTKSRENENRDFISWFFSYLRFDS